MKKYILIILSLLFSATSVAGLPEPDLPEHIKGHWIAKEIIANGMLMNIRSFIVKDDLDSTRQLFKQYLSELTDAPVIENDVQNKWYLGSGDSGYFYEVQLTGILQGVQGTFTVSKPSKQKPPKVPDNMQLLSHQRHTEVTGDWEMLIIKSTDELLDSQLAFNQFMRENDWKINPSTATNRVFLEKNNIRASAFFQQQKHYAGTLIMLTKEYPHHE